MRSDEVRNTRLITSSLRLQNAFTRMPLPDSMVYKDTFLSEDPFPSITKSTGLIPVLSLKKSDEIQHGMPGAGSSHILTGGITRAVDESQMNRIFFTKGFQNTSPKP